MHGQVNIKNDQEMVEKCHQNQLLADLVKRRSVRFGDQFPQPLRCIYHVILGVVGLLMLFLIALPSYILLIIYCRIVYRSSSSQSSAISEKSPYKMIPEFVRNVTAKMRLGLITTSTDRRSCFWYLKFLLLQIATFIEYTPNSLNPTVLFDALQNYFTKIYGVPYCVFGDGIAVGSYELVKRYIQDLPPRKGFQSFGWKVSSSLGTFSDLTTIFLSSDNPDATLSRNIVFKWLHAFPYHLYDSNSETRLHLSRLVPRKADRKPDPNLVYQSVGEVAFFLATGGQLRKNERAAFIDCVKDPSIFFPDSINFLLSGHYFERKTCNSYYTLLQAFSRHVDGPALRAAFAAANGKKSDSEVLRLITIVFTVAASPAPAKIALSVIEKLWSETDKEKNIRSFENNPCNFIKECARLDKVVPVVTALATKEIAAEIERSFQNNNENIKIYENTPIHCSLLNANRDKKIFQNPNDFIPERSDLNKMIVWNGVEEDIMNTDETKRPIRYCPGHDLSLAVIQYVAEQFSPIISQLKDNHQQGQITINGTSSLMNGNQTDYKTFEYNKSFSSTERTDEIFDQTEK